MPLLTLTEMINRAREIEAVQIPIVSDAKNGYGNVVNVVRAVREFERAGVAAIHIEATSSHGPPNGAGHEGLTLTRFLKKRWWLRSRPPSMLR